MFVTLMLQESFFQDIDVLQSHGIVSNSYCGQRVLLLKMSFRQKFGQNPAYFHLFAIQFLKPCQQYITVTAFGFHVSFCLSKSANFIKNFVKNLKFC